jgi:hypothetical protein
MAVLAMAGFVSMAGRVCAAGSEYRVQLVWGTDEARPEGKDLKPLDEATRNRLRQFRWKNYFVTQSKTSTAGVKEPTRVVLSDQCQVDLREVDATHLEVRMFNVKPGGETKHVASKRIGLAELKKGEIMVYGGDSKDRWEDCWMVIIGSHPPVPAK